MIEDGVSAPDSSARMQPSLPKSIDGYEILSHIGAGGMGAVYLAYEPLLDRKVALKVLFQRQDEEEARARTVARFLSEAVLTGKLCHAGIIPIYRVGHDPFHGYYYTMRYVKGRTLAEIQALLKSKDAKAIEHYTLPRLLTIALRVCEAIAFAHRQGVIHRDIKPGNIIVAEFGEVLVLDWGLAKRTNAEAATPDETAEVAARLSECRQRRQTTSEIFLLRDKKRGTSRLQQLQAIRPVPGSDSTKMTQANQILGTPGYLSPEQAVGEEELTPASDVYSLGATLYELLTGRMPVESGNGNAMAMATAMGNIIPIYDCAEAARVPRALCEMVMRALSLKPGERFRDAGELAETLSLYLEGRAAWKTLAEDKMNGMQLAEIWKTTGGEPRTEGADLILSAPAEMHCTRYSLGDFRCAFNVCAAATNPAWVLSLNIGEVSGEQIDPCYILRMGVEDRPFVELLRNGKRVQRRLDFRLQSAQIYRLRIELEGGHIRMWVDQRKCIDYLDVFPQTGGAISLKAGRGELHLQNFELHSRGAPLNLTFMALPDRLFRRGRHAEARELYRQLAASHPDREEGLLALYKAGLCSTALDDTQTAFNEFTKLEGTMYDHCCALGLASIGMLDGSIDFAWEALKNGYRKHRAAKIRTEMWFALLNLIETLDATRGSEQVQRRQELLDELDPEPHETGQLTFDLLDNLQRNEGFPALRAEAIRLLKKFPDNLTLVNEALFGLCRAGIDEPSVALASAALDTVMKKRSCEGGIARLHLIRAELLIASDRLDEADSHLREAIT